MSRDINDIKKKKSDAVEDHELELFKKKHNLKSDEEAYLFLKAKLMDRLGVIP